MDWDLLEVGPVGQQVVDAGGVHSFESVAGRHRSQVMLQPVEVLGQCVYQLRRDGVLHDGVPVALDPVHMAPDVDHHGLPLHQLVTLRAYGAEVARKKRNRRPDNFYELITCGWKDHALVGTDVAHLVPEDAMLAREGDGMRWYRCLRCDAWVVDSPPSEPTRDRMPDRDEIEVPLRGPMLRDRYVLRLIAVDRAVHVIVLTALAVILYTFARHDATLHRDYVNIMSDLSGTTPGESQVRGVLGYLRPRLQVLAGPTDPARPAGHGLRRPRSHRDGGSVVLQAMGRVPDPGGHQLALIPIEIYELSLRVSVFKVITLGHQCGHRRVPVVGQATVRPTGRPCCRSWSGIASSADGVRSSGRRRPCRRRCPRTIGRSRRLPGPVAGVGSRTAGGIVDRLGPLAQLVAHLHDTQGVVGSSPARPTRKPQVK